MKLQNEGVEIGSPGKLESFKIRLFACDSPARAFVTGTQAHTGKHSCPKCIQQGRYIQRRACFLQDISDLRTDESFQLRIAAAMNEKLKFWQSILHPSLAGVVGLWRK